MEPPHVFSFNLVNEPWLPCLMGDGRAAQLSLRQALVSAPHARELADASPLVTAALHRLLLAVVHRVFGPRTEGEWHELWRRRSFDVPALHAYLDAWLHRFDLFDRSHPFYQTPDLPASTAGPVSKLTHERSAGHNAILFEHSVDSAPSAMVPAEAARHLAASHAFGLSGTVTPDPRYAKSKYAYAAPLVKAAVMLLMGDSLLETLLLNLVRLDGAAAAPFEFEPGRDQPAWERDQVTLPAARSPDGYLDLLTWQSRRVLLLPELRNGSVVVPRIILMKGYQFPEGFEPHTRETMVAYQKRDRAAANQDPWPAVGFQPERALWRDSLALLQRSPRPGDLDRRVPRTFDDLAERVPVGYPVRLVALGLSALRAKVELWREERLPLPLQYLRHDELVYTLGTSLGAAESVRGALMSGVRHLAQGALSPESKPDTGRVRSMVESLGAERAYWAALDAPFRTLIVDLAATWAADQGEPALAAWRRALRDTAQQAFDAAAGALETSARGLRAAAEARGLFEAMMARTLRED